MKKQNLNSDNFFSEIVSRYPDAAQAWYEWYEKYYLENKLERIFNCGYKNRNSFPESHEMGWHSPSFDYIPIEMQIGVIMGFFHKMDIEMKFYAHEELCESVKESFKKLQFNLGGLQRKESTGQSSKLR